MSADRFLCSWCIDAQAVRFELVDGRRRPVCEAHGKEPERESDRGAFGESVLEFIRKRPGSTSGDIRRGLRLDTQQANAMVQVLLKSFQAGRLRRTGEPLKYQYWPAQKEKAA